MSTPDPVSQGSQLPLPTGERVSIHCADGAALTGHVFRAPREAGPPVLLAPATGVPQGYYFRFADWLTQRGHSVLVFDYRGIGLSRVGPLRDCTATLADWGQLDLVAALDTLLDLTGAPQAALLGHSAGAQLTGLMPNHARLTRVVGVSASTGWLAGMRPGYRAVATAVLLGGVRLGIALRGYGTCAAFGLGEDLPAGVARQWGDWCRAGGYATNAVLGQPDRDFHADVRCPIHVLYATDDDIATDTTVADLLRTFPGAPRTSTRVAPSEHGLTSLGHIAWFRASSAAVWPRIAEALTAP